MRILIVIPARKGSKGLPGKNIKMLAGKPLIKYSIDYALEVKGLNDAICVSTNDERIIDISTKSGLDVPFKRPDELSSDKGGTREVLLHAIEYYESFGEFFDTILLLQPTSPIRKVEDFKKMIMLMTPDIDMVVSVRESKDNPYFTLFEESALGYLKKSKESNYIRRQDVPPVFAFNGSMYLIRISSLKKSGFDGFLKIKKFVMPPECSFDIDTLEDFKMTEYYLKKQ